MKALLRPLLVLFLLFALSFQGMAAASMLPCAPGAPAPAAMPMDAPGHDHQAMLRAQAAAAHDHAAMAHAGGVHDTGQHDGHDGKHGGGSCASCCVGAAMAPAAPLRLALARPDFIAIPFRAGHVPSVDPAVLERPPRLSLA